MVDVRKIVLHSLHGYRAELGSHVSRWIQDGVAYVGVLGLDAERIEDVIDELCVGDGSNPYFMLTASHGADETLEDAVLLAMQLAGDLAGDVQVVKL